MYATALAALVAAVFGRAARNGFTDYDDLAYVTENPHIRSGLNLDSIGWALRAGYHGNWHPLTWMSHALDISLFGLDPAGHHLVSVALHALATVLLFHALAKMTSAPGRSAFVAGLFAVHPLHVESVAWAAERKDVLSAALGMACLLVYARNAERPSRARSVLLIVLFALGLMAKPMLVTLPFVLLLLDAWPLRRFEPGRVLPPAALVREKLPLFAMSAASSAITWIVQARAGAVADLEVVPLPSRLANAAVACATYLGTMFVPRGLAVLYPFDAAIPAWKVAGALAILIAVTVAAVRFRNRAPYLPVGWLWYLGTLLPVIGLVQVGLQSRADRYTYIPLVGVFIMLSWGLCDLFRAARLPRGSFAAVATVVLAACSVISWRQVGLWRDSETLFKHALAVTTGNFAIEGNLGGALLRENRLDEAMGHLEAATRLRPAHAPSLSNMGVVRLRQGRIAESIPLFREAVRVKPDHLEGWLNLGNALAQIGDRDGAVAAFGRAQALSPGDPAIAEFLRAASQMPQAPPTAGAAFERANALRDQRRLADAEAAYRETLRLDANHAGAHNNLGILLAMRGEAAEALQHFTGVLRLDPRDATAHFNLGALLARQGKFDEAIPHFEQVLALQPDYEAARRALDEAKKRRGR